MEKWKFRNCCRASGWLTRAVSHSFFSGTLIEPHSPRAICTFHLSIFFFIKMMHISLLLYQASEGRFGLEPYLLIGGLIVVLKTRAQTPHCIVFLSKPPSNTSQATTMVPNDAGQNERVNNITKDNIRIALRQIQYAKGILDAYMPMVNIARFLQQGKGNRHDLKRTTIVALMHQEWNSIPILLSALSTWTILFKKKEENIVLLVDHAAQFAHVTLRLLLYMVVYDRTTIASIVKSSSSSSSANGITTIVTVCHNYYKEYPLVVSATVSLLANLVMNLSRRHQIATRQVSLLILEMMKQYPNIEKIQYNGCKYFAALMIQHFPHGDGGDGATTTSSSAHTTANLDIDELEDVFLRVVKMYPHTTERTNQRAKLCASMYSISCHVISDDSEEDDDDDDDDSY
eukprot:scaffold241_cov89-Cylindrotheca_fusiformis.AAC.12